MTVLAEGGSVAETRVVGVGQALCISGERGDLEMDRVAQIHEGLSWEKPI